ncbi:MAG: hypothetical protein AAFZ65_05280 [Planctomycetota bacterium]
MLTLRSLLASTCVCSTLVAVGGAAHGQTSVGPLPGGDAVPMIDFVIEHTHALVALFEASAGAHRAAILDGSDEAYAALEAFQQRFDHDFEAIASAPFRTSSGLIVEPMRNPYLDLSQALFHEFVESPLDGCALAALDFEVWIESMFWFETYAATPPPFGPIGGLRAAEGAARHARRSLPRLFEQRRLWRAQHMPHVHPPLPFEGCAQVATSDAVGSFTYDNAAAGYAAEKLLTELENIRAELLQMRRIAELAAAPEASDRLRALLDVDFQARDREVDRLSNAIRAFQTQLLAA